MLLRISLILLSLMCQNAFGKNPGISGVFLQKSISGQKTLRQHSLASDSNSIALKKSLAKRGIKFTDSLIYLKQIIPDKIKARDAKSFFTLNQELKKQAAAINSNYFLAYYYAYDGHFKKRQRKLGAAVASLIKAVDLSEKLTTDDEKVKYYTLLSQLFFELRDSKRLKYYADKRNELLKDKDGIHAIAEFDPIVSDIIGGNLEKARLMLERKETDPKMRLPVYAFSVYFYQGHTYYKLGKYELAVALFKKAEKLEHSVEAHLPRISVHRKHGLLLVLVAMKNYQQAKSLFEQSIAEISAQMDWDDRREAFEAGAKLYEALGDDKKALKYFKKFERYKDSINNLATKKLVNDIEIKYQTSLKEKAIANQKVQLVEKDNQLQTNERHIKTILSILILLILCAIIYYLVTKNKVQAIQLNQLKSQIHPHFLFNALNSLYSLSMNKSDDAPGVVIGISNILRYILYECNGSSVSLEKEMDVIKEYVKLEKMRKKDNVEVNVNIAPNLDNYMIAPLLLLPLVENAYKHGVNKLMDDAWVNIDAKVVNGRCIFKISNNKPVEEAAKHDKTRYGNIGLQNIEKRLRILYPKKHKLEILQSEDVFIVSVEVCVTAIN
ncbi:MAG: histidine kinase [Bacteroidota bacterium]